MSQHFRKGFTFHILEYNRFRLWLVFFLLFFYLETVTWAFAGCWFGCAPGWIVYLLLCLQHPFNYLCPILSSFVGQGPPLSTFPVVGGLLFARFWRVWVLCKEIHFFRTNWLCEFLLNMLYYVVQLFSVNLRYSINISGKVCIRFEEYMRNWLDRSWAVLSCTAAADDNSRWKFMC